MRFAGIVFKVWLAAKIGAEGMGLYQIVFSVYMFAATFATSGICTAVTRLVSEELAVGQKSRVKQIVVRGIQLSLIISAFTISVLFFCSEFIAIKLLRQPDASLSLKILGFSLPFMSICSCIKGYFIARRKASPSSASQLLEQAVRIAVIVPLLLKYNNVGLKFACASVLVGDTAAEAVSCLYLYLKYRFDFNKIDFEHHNTHKPYRLLPAITHIALPITSGKYLNSLLRMAENVLVPIYLTKGTVEGNGIALFGMIKGMALPLLFFPSTLLSALSTLLIPEISESSIRGQAGVVKSIISRIIKITSLISIVFTAVFMVCGPQLGLLIYNSADVGFLLRALSPIVPFMYLDAISDGILKGLDQQKFTFITSVSDSAIRIILILFLLNKFGIFGFIAIMYFSNFFTCALNVRRLSLASGIKLNLNKTFITPVCCAFTICLFTNFILNALGISHLLFVILFCAICAPLYCAVLFWLGIVDYDDISFLKRN